VSRPRRPADPLIGRTIAGYEILERIGSDHTTATYKAHQGAMARDVAFKTLNAQAAADEATVACFYGAAKAAAQIHHANVVSIYDVSAAGSRHFCTMEYVEGRPVGELLRARQKIASVDALRVAIDVAEALRFANVKGIAGFRLSADRVVLSSHGEVKMLPPTLTAPSAPVLDDHYVLTAVGVLLYAMLSGGRVASLEATLEPGSSAVGELPRLKSVVLGARQDIARVVDRLIGASDEGRYHNVDVALADLRGLVDAQEKLESRARSATERVRERQKRQVYGIVLGAGAAAVALVVIVVLILLGGSGARRIDKEFQDARTAAKASIEQSKALQRQFYRTPSRALVDRAVAQLANAMASYEHFVARHPHHRRASEATDVISHIGQGIDDFRTRAKEHMRFVEARDAYEGLKRRFEDEVAAKLERGGKMALATWQNRYVELARAYADVREVKSAIASKLRKLPRELQRIEMKIETNQLMRRFESELRREHRYGEALAAWKAYREKYDKIDDLRKQALENYDKYTTDIRRDARVQSAKLTNHARYLATKEKQYARARGILQKIIDRFGIPSLVEKAKGELAKLPKE